MWVSIRACIAVLGTPTGPHPAIGATLPPSRQMDDLLEVVEVACHAVVPSPNQRSEEAFDPCTIATCLQTYVAISPIKSLQPEPDAVFHVGSPDSGGQAWFQCCDMDHSVVVHPHNMVCGFIILGSKQGSELVARRMVVKIHLLSP